MSIATVEENLDLIYEFMLFMLSVV